MPSIGGVMVRLAGRAKDADPNSHLRLCRRGPTVSYSLLLRSIRFG